MSAEPDDGGRPLEELRAARERAEEELRAGLDRLRRELRSMRDSGDVPEPPDASLPGAAESDPAPADDDPGPDQGPAGATTADGDPLASPALAWLLGEPLRELDRRERDVEAAVDAIRAELEHVEPLAEARAAAADRQRRQIGRRARASFEDDVTVVRVGRELSAAATEAMAALVDLQDALRALMDAKDAESAARIELGVPAKARLVVDEAQRQQRALLQRLVGSREELEALAHRIRAEGSPGA